MPRRGSLKVAALLASLAAPLAYAQTPQPPAPSPNAPPPPNVPQVGGQMITLTLTSGEIMKGVVRQLAPDYIVILHSVLGEIKIPRNGISSSEPPVEQLFPPVQQPLPVLPSGPAPAPAPQPQAAPAAPSAPPVKPGPPKPDEFVTPKNPIEALFSRDEKSFLVGWQHTVEMGMNGTTGSVDAQNYRAVINFNRSTKLMNTTGNASYVYGENNFGTTQDRGEINGRNEWNMINTPWTFWVATRAEYDSLQRWDARLHASTGIGYVIIKDASTTLAGRVGVGGSREFGGDYENAITQELGIAAVQLDHRFNDKTSMYATFEYYPNMRETEDFRTVSRAGLQWVVDPELKMSLRMGVEHRYDSLADAESANVVDYFIVLGFAF